jgi:putative cell wall-binding protein
MKVTGPMHILLFIWFLSSILLPSEAAQLTHDVIVVRADLPIDYVVAQAYAHKEGIPIVTTDPLYLDDSVRRELEGYRSEGASIVLIIGGSDTAISTDIEQELRQMGYQTHRLWDWDRIGTAARVAIELWNSSHYAVIAHADVSESYLVASSISINLEAPILLTTEDELPDTTIQALETLRVKEVFLVGPQISRTVEVEIQNMGILIQRVGKDIEVKNIDVIGNEKSVLHQIQQPLPLLVGGIIGLCVGYVFSRIFKKVKKREIPMFVLTEDEQKVVEAIGDGLKQEKLPELTNFSRPKITRIISDLEAKQIISRTKYGKTYRIRVMKSIVED